MDDAPKSVWSGSFNLFGVEVKCHVLSDGQRIIEAESMDAIWNAMSSEGGASVDREEVARFARWRRGEAE